VYALVNGIDCSSGRKGGRKESKSHRKRIKFNRDEDERSPLKLERLVLAWISSPD
jgi:hypothetical protein